MPIRISENITNGYLNDYVHSFWKTENTGDSISNHTIIPDGYFSLVVIYVKGKLRNVILHGIYTEPTCISIPESGVIFGIHFKLLSAEYLFTSGFKPGLNQRKILPVAYRNINSFGVDDFDAFKACITNDIESRIPQLSNIDERKLQLFKHIYQNDTRTIEDLTLKVNWGSRQINRYFSSEYGFSLKELMKIIRCRKNIENMTPDNFYPKMQYYDQSHFIKEVKRYTGTTPARLKRNMNKQFIQLLA